MKTEHISHIQNTELEFKWNFLIATLDLQIAKVFINTQRTSFSFENIIIRLIHALTYQRKSKAMKIKETGSLLQC